MVVAVVVVAAAALEAAQPTAASYLVAAGLVLYLELGVEVYLAYSGLEADLEPALAAGPQADLESTPDQLRTVLVAQTFANLDR